MPDRMAWFEREFALGLPQWMLPNVIERLRGTPARLEELTHDLAPDVITRRDGDRWSVNEHAGHLLDLCSLDAARVEDYRAGRDALTPADLRNRKTHEARHNERALADVIADFRRERAEFVRNLEAFDDETASRPAVHPRLKKPMRVVDFAFFVAEHDDHHLAAISELLRKFTR